MKLSKQTKGKQGMQHSGVNMFSLKQGIELVKAARNSIVNCAEHSTKMAQFTDGHLRKKDMLNTANFHIADKNVELKGYSKKQGVFVTLHSYPSMQLRGCIGFPEPIMPLKKAVIEAAKAAAFEDPRFPPVDIAKEKFIVDVSVLTLPEEIKAKPANLPKHVKIGEDGLIVRYGRNSGLLLPQVFQEWNATPEMALSMTCEKAGLPKEFWKTGKCRFFKFRAQIFREKEPNGKVVEERHN